MDLDLQNIANGIALLFAGGILKWAVSISREINNIKVRIAEEGTSISDKYVKKDDLRQVLTDVISPINRRLDDIAEDLKRIKHAD